MIISRAILIVRIFSGATVPDPCSIKGITAGSFPASSVSYLLTSDKFHWFFVMPGWGIANLIRQLFISCKAGEVQYA
jgi:hypothetical protein